MSKDLEIVSEYNDCYEDAYRVWDSFYPLADRDLRFYLGDQWDAQERKNSLKRGVMLLSSREHFEDPMNPLGKFKSKTHVTNFCNWESPEYTQLLEQSFYEEGKARLDILEQAEEIFLREMPYIPLYHEDYVYITNPQFPFTIPLWCNDRMLMPL